MRRPPRAEPKAARAKSASKTGASVRAPPGAPPTSRLPAGYRTEPVHGYRSPLSTEEGLPQFPPPPSERSAPSTPKSPSRLRLRDLRPFHSVHREQPGSALPQCLTTRQASLALRTVQLLPLKRAFDAGLQPGPFPGRTASLLPGSLAITRTGLSPAGDDELLIRS